MLLMIGLFADVIWLVYASIVCAMAAGLVLLFYSRLSQREAATAGAGGPQGQARTAPSAPPAGSGAPAPEPGSTEPAPARGWEPPPPPEPVPEPTATLSVVGRGGRDNTEVGEGVGVAAAPSDEQDLGFPIADYDELRVSEILPLLPELDLDELDMVREREEAGKRRLTVINRIDELMDELEAEEVPVAVAGPAPDGFPIEDLESLPVEEIVAVIPILSDEELDLLAEREEQGQNRAAVLDAIDDQFEEVEIEEEEVVAAPVAAIAAKKVSAKKVPAKKAAVKKVPAKRAVKKVTAKKVPAKKFAVKKVAVKKVPAKKVPAKKAGKATKKR
ncbi:MAG: hypothetical protein M3378_10855 [Actinomycetota bacterium]|nr:hypothetical protein [Actinomycetota bacterium]